MNVLFINFVKIMEFVLIVKDFICVFVRMDGLINIVK